MSVHDDQVHLCSKNELWHATCLQMQLIISSTKTEHFSCSRELLSIEFLQMLRLMCLFFLVRIKKGWSNPMWCIIMWILLSHLGCWRNKCSWLCQDFWVFFLAYVLLSVRRSFSLLLADSVRNNLHLQILWITYFVQILLASRIITDVPSCVFVRRSTCAGREGAMLII